MMNPSFPHEDMKGGKAFLRSGGTGPISSGMRFYHVVLPKLFRPCDINCEELFPSALGLNEIEHPAALLHELPRVVAEIGARRHEAPDELLPVAAGNDEEFGPEA